MNTLCFGYKNPKTGIYWKGGCAFNDDLASNPERLSATARQLFLETFFELKPNEVMSLEEFRYWDMIFNYDQFELAYWIEEAAE
jgi:hypothetical protein